MQNRFLELHDSEVASVVLADKKVVVQLRPAYIHSSDGEPGVDPGIVSLQKADLILSDAVLAQSSSSIPAAVSEGRIRSQEETFSNGVALPFDFEGAISLELVLVTGETLLVTGARLNVELLGQPEYLERFS